MLTLIGTLALYLSADWMSDQDSHFAKPFEAMNSYLTTMPTKETAFDQDNDNESVLNTEHPLYYDTHSSLSVEDNVHLKKD